MSQLSIEGIGLRIARYRKRNGWSAQKLADNTNGAVSRETLANIETGRRADMSLTQFLEICLALRVPPAALLVDLEHPLEPSNIRFAGSAPVPLEPHAPRVALARWLNGQHPDDITHAARWVAEVTTALTDYLDATDAAAMIEARHRLHNKPDGAEHEQFADRRRRAIDQLTALGIELPVR